LLCNYPPMTDKILTFILAAILVLILSELIIPGEKHLATIESISTDNGLSVSKSITQPYSNYTITFDNRTVIEPKSEVSNFKTGDSIEYTLTPVMKNIRSIQNKATNFQMTIHSYFSLIMLMVICVVGQIANITIRWSKKNKEMIQILLFCLIFVMGYIFIYK
jgi:hypothetical protein